MYFNHFIGRLRNSGGMRKEILLDFRALLKFTDDMMGLTFQRGKFPENKKKKVLKPFLSL
jgi:hypothetical protein